MKGLGSSFGNQIRKHLNSKLDKVCNDLQKE